MYDSLFLEDDVFKQPVPLIMKKLAVSGENVKGKKEEKVMTYTDCISVSLYPNICVCVCFCVLERDRDVAKS